jgi:hypothetical protein
VSIIFQINRNEPNQVNEDQDEFGTNSAQKGCCIGSALCMNNSVQKYQKHRREQNNDITGNTDGGVSIVSICITCFKIRKN